MFEDALRILIEMPLPLYLLILGGLIFFKWSRFGRIILIVGSGSLLFLSTPIIPKILGMPLYGAVPVANSSTRADLIIVPTAGVWLDPFGRWAPGYNTMLRLKKALEWQKTTGLSLLLVGGNPNSVGRSEADVTIENLGLQTQNIQIETSAKNTWETAKSISQYKQDGKVIRSVILITSAEHILRMSASLRFFGLNVSTVPVFEPVRLNEMSFPRDFYPNGYGTGLLGIVSHEYLGIIWYWIKGRLELNDLLGDGGNPT